MPIINARTKEMQNGDVVLSYSNTVGPQSETFTFLTPQETVILFNRGSKGISYTIDIQSGTLFPSQYVKVTGMIADLVLSSQGGTQHFEIWAEEAGTVSEGGLISFQTLTDLQNTYPNGISQPVWVVANNSWYYWGEATITPPPTEEPPPSTGGSTIVSATFTGANNPSAIPNAETGQSWQVYSRSSLGAAGVYGVIDGTLYCSNKGGNNGLLDEAIVVDSGYSDNIAIEGTIVVPAKGNAGAETYDFSRLTWRVTDSLNQFLVQSSTNSLLIYKFQNSTNPTLVQTVNGYAFSNNSVVKVELTGSTHKLYLDGVLVATFTDTFNQSATKHGFGNNNTTVARYDNFKVTTL